MKPASASVFIFILLACSAVVCAAGWFLCSLSRRVLLRFIPLSKTVSRILIRKPFQNPERRTPHETNHPRRGAAAADAA